MPVRIYLAGLVRPCIEPPSYVFRELNHTLTVYNEPTA
jgi:hypothetical protein